MPIDYIKALEKIPTPLRLPALTTALELAIPFNAGLGMKITTLSREKVIIRSPDRRKRRNHVGSAHACFLALLSEYPAGLLLAQKYSFSQYRIIISELKIEYLKQGRGPLTATALAPEEWPEFINGEAFLDMQTVIKNDKEEPISICYTRWQIKEWKKVRSLT